MAEQGGFKHVVGDGRAVDRDKGLFGAARLLVDIPRQHFFTGAGLAGDQHGGIATRHTRCQFQQLCAGRLKGNRAFAVGIRNNAECMPGNQFDQGFRLKGFDQVIRRALAHGVHRPLHGAMGGHQQHRQLRLARAQQAEQLVAVHAGHVDVTDHQAERFLLNRLQGFLGRTDRPVVMARQQQRVSQCFTQGAIVFDQ